VLKLHGEKSWFLKRNLAMRRDCVSCRCACCDVVWTRPEWWSPVRQLWLTDVQRLLAAW